MWGSIAEAGPDSFVLMVANTPTTMKYAEVKKIKAPMDGGTRARIVTAIVVGGLLGITLIAASQDRNPVASIRFWFSSAHFCFS
jgi:hypothetical protein